MTERDKLRRALGGENAGGAGGGQGVALRQVSVAQRSDGSFTHADAAPGKGLAIGRRLVVDVNHAWPVADMLGFPRIPGDDTRGLDDLGEAARVEAGTTDEATV